MKTLARFIIPLALLSCAFFAGFSFAKHRSGQQHFGHHEGNREAYRKKRLDRLSRKLELDAAQKSELQAIFEKRRAKLDTLRSKIRPQFKEIRTTSHEKISAMLNAEQKALFEEHRKKMKERRKKRKGHWRGRGRWHDEEKKKSDIAAKEIPE